MLFDLDHVKIRNIEPKDIISVAEIEKECFSKPWSVKMIEEKLGNDTSVFIVAEYDSKIIGYIGASAICGECYIDNIAVTANFRRMGLAKLILSKCIIQAKIQNCELITLEVRKSNQKAINLYQMEQFESVGERKAYYNNPTENALIMTKYL